MVNLVFVSYDHREGKYLYQLPTNVSLKAGDLVTAPVRKSQTLGTCATDSFKVPVDVAKTIIEKEGITDVRMLAGRAKRTGWEQMPW